MILKRYKKYFGLCQCKGCINYYEHAIIAVYPYSGGFYPARLCLLHALEALDLPFVELRRF